MYSFSFESTATPCGLQRPVVPVAQPDVVKLPCPKTIIAAKPALIGCSNGVA